MKNNWLLVLLVGFLVFTSCDTKNDDDYAEYLVARPIKLSKTELRVSCDVEPPTEIKTSGKIYAYKEYIFVNDQFLGIHVIDNSDPSNPQKIAFIKIPGNVDISVKDDLLYADSVLDLVVLDISNINNIKEVNRLEDVFYNNIVWPVDAQIFEETNIDYQNEIIVGWETVTEKRLISEYEERFNRTDDLMMETASNSDASTTGQGGSLARFKIVDNYLYVVDSHNINIFSIENIENPSKLESVFAGFDIETIFNRGNHLFLGSMRGMYIYNIEEPATPTFVSEFEHGTACDPVVVDDNYAYVTLRGGNMCGATESGLFVIDISDIANPVLLKTYPMDEPYGLGIKDEKLFVCDGASGLKVYDKTDVENLVSLNHFANLHATDVIPLDQSLLMIGDNLLSQYSYSDTSIELLSALTLN